MCPSYQLLGAAHRVTPIRGLGTHHVLDVDGERLQLDFRWAGQHEALVTLAGVTRKVYAAQDGHALFIHLDGRTWRVEAMQAFGDAAGDDAGAGARIQAPMPGVVLEVHVAVGDVVAETDVLALLESMKMQTEIKAPSAGVVTAIHVAVGESFERGAPLIEIEADAIGAAPASSSPQGSTAQTPA